MVAAPNTEIEACATPFLRQSRIFRVEYQNPNRPVLFYVGQTRAGAASLLTGQPDAFVRLAREDRISINSAETATAYATLYLEVTRSMSELTYLVRSVDEVRFRPNLDEAGERKRRDFVRRYSSAISPPAAERNANGFTVSAYVIRQQSLERHRLEVAADGGIEDHAETLERDLPVVYGL